MNNPLKHSPKMRVLLIDDDESYCSIIKRTGDMCDVKVTTMSAIENVSTPQYWDYDLVILDYHLESVNALELAGYLRDFGCSIPILLISHTKQNEGKKWPHGIKGFFHKSIGARAILDASLRFGRNVF